MRKFKQRYCDYCKEYTRQKVIQFEVSTPGGNTRISEKYLCTKCNRVA